MKYPVCIYKEPLDLKKYDGEDRIAAIVHSAEEHERVLASWGQKPSKAVEKVAEKEEGQSEIELDSTAAKSKSSKK